MFHRPVLSFLVPPPNDNPCVLQGQAQMTNVLKFSLCWSPWLKLLNSASRVHLDSASQVALSTPCLPCEGLSLPRPRIYPTCVVPSAHQPVRISPKECTLIKMANIHRYQRAPLLLKTYMSQNTCSIGTFCPMIWIVVSIFMSVSSLDLP